MIQFGLFLLVNAVLILRPTDLIPGLGQAPIYESVILVALVASARQIVGQLTPTALASRPVTLFVLSMFLAVMASHLSRGRTLEAQDSGFMYFKILLYYLLLVANIRTVPKLEQFVKCLVLMIYIHAFLSILQYFGHVDIEALKSLTQRELDRASGAILEIPRLRGAGIFNDPNEFCVLLAVGFLLCLYLVGDRRGGASRLVWCVPLAVFAAGIPLTYSRGGMLALLLGVLVFTAQRYGLRRGILCFLFILPIIALAAAGRQTKFTLDDPEDTSQHRLRLWSEGLIMLRESPVFGIGQGTYPERAGLAAHNSFIEAYAELGFLGGTCFTAAVAYPLWALWRVRRRLHPHQNPTLSRMHPFVIAVLVTQTAGLMSLSRLYTQTTYLVVGLSAVFLQLTSSALPSIVPHLTTGRTLKLALFGVTLLLSLRIFVHLFVRWA